HGRRDVALSATPRLGGDQWARFGARMTEVAEHVRGRGLRFAYHHHLGTVVERAADLDAFLRHTGEAVGLTLDTGHAALGGIDPPRVIREPRSGSSTCTARTSAATSSNACTGKGPASSTACSPACSPCPV